MRNEVLNVDCMDFLKTCKNKEYDLAILDPPYGLNITTSGRLSRYNSKKDGNKNNWDKQTPTPEYFDEIFRVAQNVIIWGGNYFDLPPCKCFLIWDKQQPEGVSFASCEYAWTNLEGTAKTFYKSPQATKEHRIHETQKPIDLYKWILKRYAKSGFKILDTHVGSGSIRIACYDMGFDFVGCEINADYWTRQQKRYEEHTSQGTLFDIVGGELKLL